MSESSCPPIDPGETRRASPWREAALVALLALTLNLTGNGRTSLWDRDEPRYAGCTREMRARGDWVYPTFNGEPRFHKPILIYWVMRLGFAVGGDNPFGARLASSLAGVGTSLLVLALGRRMFGPRVGLLAALMLTTAPIMVIESKLATTDATLALLLVGSQFCLWELSRKPSKRLAMLLWLMLGLATLTKGPVGLALVACSGVVSWWWGGPTAVWGRLHARLGLPLFLLVTAPWLVAVGILSRGEFFRFALGKQVAARVVTGLEQHGGFPGYYLVSTLLTFHPWSALLPAALFGAWTRRRLNPDFGFLLGWVVGPLILLECVRTKLVHYYLPAYPACALLTAWLIDAVMTRGEGLDRWPLGRLGVRLLGGVGVAVSAAFVAGAMVSPPDLRWPCLTIALVVGSGSLWGEARFRRAETGKAVAGLAVTWAATMLLVSGWLLPAAEPFRTSRLVGERLAALAREFSAAPLLLSFQEPSVVYAMGRSAPMIRTWARFYEVLDREGAVVTAMIPLEVPEFERRSDELELDVRETVAGFNLNKGATQTLRLVVIRRRPARVTASKNRALK